jgi:hypothetical protein
MPRVLRVRARRPSAAIRWRCCPRADEGHAAVARRTIDRDTGVLQAFAGGVDVVDFVGDVAEVPALAIILRIPVPGQLDRAIFLSFGRDEHERKAAGRDFLAVDLLEAELAAVERQRFVEISDAYHCMQITHGLILHAFRA